MSSRTICRLRRTSRALAYRESRTQFFVEKSSTLAHGSNRTQFFEQQGLSNQALSDLIAQNALQNDKIVVFLAGQKYVVPRSKLLEWDQI